MTTAFLSEDTNILTNANLQRWDPNSPQMAQILAIEAEQEKTRRDQAAPEKVSKATAAGIADKDLTWHVTPGKLPIKLTPEQAAINEAKMAADADAKTQAEAGVVIKRVLKEPVVIPFPTRVIMVEEKDGKLVTREDYNGTAGATDFQNGLAIGWVSYRRVMSMSASGFRLIDAVSLAEKGVILELSPHTINHDFVPENIFWNPGNPLPDRCEPWDFTYLGVLVGKALPETIKADIEAEKSLAIQGPIPLVAGPIVIGVDTPAGETMDPAKLELLVKLLPMLRPGHKDDWTPTGEPDCNRLSKLVKLHAQENATFTSKVTKKERDLAWQRFTINKVDPENVTNAFSVPADQSVLAILRAAADKNGVRVVRQLAESKGIATSKDTEELLTLTAAGVTAEEASRLL